jgi:hypothetical protein
VSTFGIGVAQARAFGMAQARAFGMAQARAFGMGQAREDPNLNTYCTGFMNW